MNADAVRAAYWAAIEAGADEAADRLARCAFWDAMDRLEAAVRPILRPAVRRAAEAIRHGVCTVDEGLPLDRWEAAEAVADILEADGFERTAAAIRRAGR